MSHENSNEDVKNSDNNSSNSQNWKRRSMLSTSIGALLLGSLTPLTSASSSFEEIDMNSAPNPYEQTGSDPEDKTSDVYHSYYLYQSNTQKMIDQYNNSQDETVIISDEVLERSKEQEKIPLLVRTVGEKTSVTSKGHLKRNIHGWRSTTDEVDHLRDYGKVAFVPKFASTRINLHDVDTSDISEIAKLGFVTQVSYDPEIRKEDCDTIDQWHFDPDDAYGSKMTKLSETSSWNAHGKIAILDWGYKSWDSSYDAYGNWETPHAAVVGIDSSLSDDFSADYDEDWDDPDDDHGANVANTAGYFLWKGQHYSNSFDFVILRIDGGDNTERARAAIEFCEENDISVANMSFGTDGPRNSCPNTYCDLLKSYCEAGYIPVASTGNDYLEDEVTFPGGEYWSIGVGSLADDCSNRSGICGYMRASYSNYGTVLFGSGASSTCLECDNAVGSDREKFSPNIYAPGTFDIPGNEKFLSGTSIAAPVVSVCASLLSNSRTWATIPSIMEDMDSYEVCNSGTYHPDPAELGQVLDFEYAEQQT